MNSATRVSFENENVAPPSLDVAEPDAERLDHADQQRGEERARDAPHPAHNDHDERIRDRAEIEEELRRLARDLQRAAEPGERRPESEDTGEEPLLVDAERSDHLAVLGRSADERAPAGAGQREPQRPQHRRTDRDQEQVVLGERAAEDLDRPAQARRARSEEILGAPEPEREVLDDERQREGREQLEELRRVIDAPQDGDLDQGADHTHHQRRGDHPTPESRRARVELRDEAVSDVDPQHVQRAVREVHDPRDAEDQRQADGDEKQRRRARQTVEELDSYRSQGGVLAHELTRWRPRAAAQLRRRPQSAGRSFFTSASGGRYFAPST